MRSPGKPPGPVDNETSNPRSYHVQRTPIGYFAVESLLAAIPRGPHVQSMVNFNRFNDRHDAGRRLAGALKDAGIEADIVLAIPRGGLPLGRVVADELGAELDVVVAQKIGAPGNPEFALGAVASDGSVWRNEQAFSVGYGDSAYFDNQRARKAEAARAKLRQYRGTDTLPDVSGRTVVLVDDGIATGSTMRACLAQIREAGPDRLVVAVPVGPPDTIRDLESVADVVICPLVPRRFQSVGQYYDRFDQVRDEVAKSYLD